MSGFARQPKYPTSASILGMQFPDDFEPGVAVAYLLLYLGAIALALLCLVIVVLFASLT